MFPCLKMAFLALALPGRYHVCLLDQSFSDYASLGYSQAALLSNPGVAAVFLYGLDIRHPNS